MKKYTKEHTGLDIEFKFSVLDPTEILKSIRPYVWDGILSKSFDLEKVGLGIQSAFAIALARAYAEIVRRPLILAIEEPELYLHPQACRHFYNLLHELSEQGFQIIFTTHNNAFVNIANHKEIHLVRKVGGRTVVNSGIDINLTPDESLKLASMCDNRMNEIFFADYVILVEGPTDQVACTCALKQQGCNIEERNVSIIECGGKNDINYLASLLSQFEVNCHVVYDGDSPVEVGEAERILGADNVFVQRPNLEGLLGMPRKPTRKDALVQFPAWFNVNRMPQIYIDLKNKVFGP